MGVFLFFTLNRSFCPISAAAHTQCPYWCFILPCLPPPFFVSVLFYYIIVRVFCFPDKWYLVPYMVSVLVWRREHRFRCQRTRHLRLHLCRKLGWNLRRLERHERLLQLGGVMMDDGRKPWPPDLTGMVSKQPVALGFVCRDPRFFFLFFWVFSHGREKVLGCW